MNQQQWMQAAINAAGQNPEKPFGSVLVDVEEQLIVASGCNASDENPIQHGEIVAISNYAESAAHHDWSKLALYTTAEPCPMCQAAIIWSGIPQVVYGTSAPMLRRLGWNQFRSRAQETIRQATWTKCSLIGGVLEHECNELFEAAKSRLVPR